MSAIIAWFQSNHLALGAFIMGLLDFLIAIIPGIDSNGVFHGIYTFLKGLFSPTPST